VQIRALTSRPFAINLWIPFEDSDHPAISAEAFDRNAALLAPYYRELGIAPAVLPDRFGPAFDDQVAAALEAKPALLTFVFGIPTREVLEACRRQGILTAGTATTVDEAVAIERAGVDLVVASGFEAGGHRGSFLKPAEESLTGTFALVPQVVGRVRIPVIAAGGIADGRGIAASLALGAGGVQIGTAFLACDESAISGPHRDRLFSAPGDTVLSRVFSGRLARGIRNRLIDEMRPYEATLPRYPVQNWFTARLREPALDRGSSDLIALSAGQAAPLVRRASAQHLVRELVEETERVLRHLSLSAPTA
jgi:nitronate monooxygenase